MELYDAHNHLQQCGAPGPEFPGGWNDLGTLDIAGAVVNGTCEADWPQVAGLARQHRWVIPAYGVHPWQVSEVGPEWQKRLEAALEGGGTVGEIGLDLWKRLDNLEQQKEVFLWQLRLAAERNLPVTLHCLRAWDVLWSVLEREPTPERGFLLHAYGGPPDRVKAWAERGAFFSFSGSFLARERSRKREPFRHVPADRLLMETDAPSMPLPPEHRRFTLPGDAAEGESAPPNHPANLVAVYHGFAAWSGRSVASVAEQVAGNFRRLFGVRVSG
ncbi:MAG TPA: TatD family hydrolase [Chthoniobacteraceae bacterium]|nr:TatD family hydrolase [Chthoniobacteraceae bacterium]